MSIVLTEVEQYQIKRILRRFYEHWLMSGKVGEQWTANVSPLLEDEEAEKLDMLCKLLSVGADSLGDEMSELMELLGMGDDTLYMTTDDRNEANLIGYQAHIGNRDRRTKMIVNNSS
ncbi:MAG: hypothetical protein AB8B89_04200 [Gammaproteobacteria bacterium]